MILGPLGYKSCVSMESYPGVIWGRESIGLTCALDKGGGLWQGFGLVGLHMKYVLTDNLFTVSRCLGRGCPSLLKHPKPHDIKAS